MKLDIIITFNQIETMTGVNDQKIGYKQKYIDGKPLSYVEQLCVLVESIKKNWNRYEYNIFALHSKPLAQEHVDKIESLGAKVILKNESLFPHRHNNRLTAYDTDFCKGTHSLILDADMIALSELPVFNEDIAVQSMPGKHHLMPVKAWKTLAEKYDFKACFENDTEFPFRSHHTNCEEEFLCLNFNNGSVLIKNDKKQEFKEDMIYIANDYLKQPECTPHVEWAAEQAAMSITLLRTGDWGILPKGFNFLSSEQQLLKDKDYEVSLYHYLGRNENNRNVKAKFKEYFEIIGL